MNPSQAPEVHTHFPWQDQLLISLGGAWERDPSGINAGLRPDEVFISLA